MGLGVCRKTGGKLVVDEKTTKKTDDINPGARRPLRGIGEQVKWGNSLSRSSLLVSSGGVAKHRVLLGWATCLPQLTQLTTDDRIYSHPSLGI